MNARHVLEWQYTSAYFNGDAVRVELIAHPGAGENRVSIDFAMVNAFDGNVLASQCGPTDDRTLSDDVRAGRAMPVGCTAWLFNDANHCFLTAGHCAGGSLQIVQFNVPLSDSSGNIRHPGPEDQYAVDSISVQAASGGVGNDWCYFGCFANSTTGLTPFQAQGDSYILASAPPPVQNQPIRITGFGVDSSPPEWNQVQQTHAGPFVSHAGTALGYQTDTQGGNSGSSVVDDTSGLAIGIHTHGGCQTNGSGNNSGTAINHSGLQNALANPRGVCQVGIDFLYPGGRPAAVDPSGGVAFTVEVVGVNGGMPEPGSARLHVDTGGGFQTLTMNEIADNLYEASFPATPCGDVIHYYLSAETDTGAMRTDPLGAPGTSYSIVSASASQIAFDDDFEGDLGWSVSGNATAGQWQRGIPVGGGDRGDPPTDADGSGRCYLTGNTDGDSDVDGGATVLTSPVFDGSAGSGGDTWVSYHRWYSNTFGSAPESDIFEVEISNNGGASWIDLETVGPSGPEVSGGWYHRSFRIADVLPPSASMRLRFTASDLGEGSVVEAAVDGVQVIAFSCGDTELVDFAVVEGAHVSGGLSDLFASDDSHLRVRSEIGLSAFEPNVLDVVFGAVTTAEDHQTIDLIVESRIDNPSGAATLRLRNWSTNQFETVAAYGIGTTEDVFAVDGASSADRVRPSDGRLELSARHVVIATFSVLGFDSFFDHVRMEVD
jgi:hypothetical protein